MIISPVADCTSPESDEATHYCLNILQLVFHLNKFIIAATMIIKEPTMLLYNISEFYLTIINAVFCMQIFLSRLLLCANYHDFVYNST